MFGGYNTSLMTSDLSWNQLVANDSSLPWWLFDIQQASYNGVSFLTTGEYALMDSGTSLLGIPSADYDSIMEMIKDSYGTGIKCSSGLCYILEPCENLLDSFGNLTF